MYADEADDTERTRLRQRARGRPPVWSRRRCRSWLGLARTRTRTTSSWEPKATPLLAGLPGSWADRLGRRHQEAPRGHRREAQAERPGKCDRPRLADSRSPACSSPATGGARIMGPLLAFHAEGRTAGCPAGRCPPSRYELVDPVARSRTRVTAAKRFPCPAVRLHLLPPFLTTLTPWTFTLLPETDA